MKKNLIQRFGALAMAMVLSLGTATNAFAAEANEMNNVVDSTVQYNVNGTFTVVIPQYIDVTAFTSLYASEINLAPDTYIRVNLTQIPANGIYSLTHTSGKDTIDVIFSGEQGQVTPTQTYLAKFDGTSENSTSFSASMTEESAATTHKAGTYRGTVRFEFMIDYIR